MLILYSNAAPTSPDLKTEARINIGNKSKEDSAIEEMEVLSDPKLVAKKQEEELLRSVHSKGPSTYDIYAQLLNF